MRGPLSALKYAMESATGNLENMGRAGSNNAVWGTVGGAIVGAVLGSAVPIVGTIIGFVVGGILGSTVAYMLS